MEDCDTTAAGHREKNATLVHPPSMSPIDLGRFIQLPGFSRGWKQMKLGDRDLEALAMLLMANPQGPPVVPQTGGLRKVRFAPVSWKCGKSGAARVGYAVYPEYSVFLLVTAYPKSRKDDLTLEEKGEIKKALAEFGKLLQEGRVKAGRPTNE